MNIQTRQSKEKESVFISGVLIDIDIYWWKGWTHLTANDIDKEESDIPDIIKLGSKRMLDNAVFKELQVIDSRSRVLIDKYSYPFMISTVRFVPYTVLPELLEELTQLQKAFNAFVENFIFTYDLNKQNFLAKYPQYEDKLKDRYPTAWELRSRFLYTWQLFEMQIPQDIKAEMIDENQVAALQDAWSDSRNKVEERLNSWVETVAKLMRKEIVTICKNMKDSLDEGKIVRASTLERARDTVKRLRSMNFIEDEGIEEVLNSLESQIPQDWDREVPEIMNAFSGTLKSTMDEMGTLSDVNTETGKYRRRFIL